MVSDKFTIELFSIIDKLPSFENKFSWKCGYEIMKEFDEDCLGKMYEKVVLFCSETSITQLYDNERLLLLILHNIFVRKYYEMRRNDPEKCGLYWSGLLEIKGILSNLDKIPVKNDNERKEEK